MIATSGGSIRAATIRVPASEAQGSYGIGDALPGIGRSTHRLALGRRDRSRRSSRRLDLLGKNSSDGGGGKGEAQRQKTRDAADLRESQRIKKIEENHVRGRSRARDDDSVPAR